MRLARFPAGRNAHSHSPTREQRELSFADAGKPPAGQTPGTPGPERDAGPEIRETRATPEARGVSETLSRGFKDRITALTSRSVEKIPPATFRSELLYRSLISVDITEREAEANPDLRAARERLSRLDRTGTVVPPEEERAREVEALLRNPDVLARTIKQIDERVERHEATSRFIATVEEADPEIVRLTERKIAAEGIDDEAQRAEEVRRVDALLSARARSAMAGFHDLSNRKRRKRDPKAPEIRPDEERDADRFLWNVHDALHRKITVTGYVQRQLLDGGKAANQEQAERLAVEMMRDQSSVLRRALDAAIREGAVEQRERTVGIIAKVLGVQSRTAKIYAEAVDAMSWALQDEKRVPKAEDKRRIDEARKYLKKNQAVVRGLHILDEHLRPKGLSAHALCIRLRDAQTDLEGYQADHSADPSFPQYAEQAIRRLRELQSENAKAVELEESKEQEELEEWAAKTEERLERLDLTDKGPFANLHDEIHHYARTTPEQRREFRKIGVVPDNPGGCVSALKYTPEKRRMIEDLIDSFEDPRVVELRKEEDEEIAKDIADLAPALKTLPGIKRVAEVTRRRLEKVVPELLEATGHDALKALGVPSALLERQKSSGFALEAVAGMPAESLQDALYETVRVQRDVERMERALVEIRKLPTPAEPLKNVEFTDDMEPGEQGHFLNGKIALNTELRADPAAAWPFINHERGHAMIHYLTRKKETRVLPFFVYADLRRKEPVPLPGGDTFGSRLEKLGGAGIPPENPVNFPYKGVVDHFRGKPEKLREELMEELILRYADWKDESDPEKKARNYAPLEVELFEILGRETDNVADSGKGISIDPLESLGKPPSAEADGEDFRRKTTTAGPPPSGPASGESATEINVRDKLEAVKATILKAELFVKSYGGKMPEVASIMQTAADDAKTWYEHLNAQFTGDNWKDYPPRPEENWQFKEYVKKVSEHCDRMNKHMNKIETNQLDTTNAPRKKRGFFDVVKFWSVADLVKFVKDSVEDFQSMYKRAQDRKIKEVGDEITGALRGFKTGISTIDRYLNGLNAYHKRRYSGTEVEAANKWKEGMENEDSHTLLHFLHVTKNKDAVRGIISLLCHRGEMEWDDVGVWRTLQKLSRYGIGMPEEAMKHNDVLRDTWLRKMITEIWDDRELYYHWRTENDSRIKSGKQAFTDTADQLSNISGGMRAELEKQLRLKQQAIDAGEAPPEDVKPHLYEEVLEYAIRNGKMSMEDKFYYLIHGVTKGILGIERLRSLAGEKGEILMKFPFIDFFYQKNNSIEELRRFAEETQERDANGNVTFRPGLKTTLFLYYRVSRSESVRARISKATSRIAEGIDHEDIPFLITQLDYGTVNNLAAVISGSRQKVTIEGWKNAYVGFNTHMKIFGELAYLDSIGLDRFTKNDARSLAQTLTSYVFMDNILTRRGTDKDDSSRPALTADQFESTCPSGGPIPTKEYRDRMNKFIARLLDPRYLGSILPPDTQLLEYTKKERVPAQGGQPEIPEEKAWITVADVVRLGADATKLDKNSSKKQGLVYNAIGALGEKLKEKLTSERGYQLFKQFLRDYNPVVVHNSGSEVLLNEGDQFSRGEVEGIVRNRNAPAHHP